MRLNIARIGNDKVPEGDEALLKDSKRFIQLALCLEHIADPQVHNQQITLKLTIVRIGSAETIGNCEGVAVGDKRFFEVGSDQLHIAYFKESIDVEHLINLVLGFLSRECSYQ